MRKLKADTLLESEVFQGKSEAKESGDTMSVSEKDLVKW